MYKLWVILNIHIDDLDNSDAKQFNDVCMAIGLEQVVNFGSHIQGHTLDLVLHESNSSIKIRKNSARNVPLRELFCGNGN